MRPLALAYHGIGEMPRAGGPARPVRDAAAAGAARRLAAAAGLLARDVRRAGRARGGRAVRAHVRRRLRQQRGAAGPRPPGHGVHHHGVARRESTRTSRAPRSSTPTACAGCTRRGSRSAGTRSRTRTSRSSRSRRRATSSSRGGWPWRSCSTRRSPRRPTRSAPRRRRPCARARPPASAPRVAPARPARSTSRSTTRARTWTAPRRCVGLRLKAAGRYEPLMGHRPGRALRRAGRLTRRPMRPFVLVHHGVGDVGDADDPDRLVVSPARLEAQLRLLRRLRYEFVTAEELIARGPARRTAVLTFDDGWRDALTVVAPLLEQRGLRASFYVCPGLWGTQHASVTGPAGVLLTRAETARARGARDGGRVAHAHPSGPPRPRRRRARRRVARLARGGRGGHRGARAARSRTRSGCSTRACRAACAPRATSSRSPGARGASYDPFAVGRLPGPPRHGAGRLALKLLGVRRAAEGHDDLRRARLRAPMRILLVAPYGVIGGAELALFTFLAHRPPDAEVRALLVSDGPLARAPRRRRRADLDRSRLRRARRARGTSGASRRSLSGLLRRWRPDVVWALGQKSALLAAPACRMRGVPLVWHKVDLSWDRELAMPLAAAADGVIAVSEGAAPRLGPLRSRVLAIVPPPVTLAPDVGGAARRPAHHRHARARRALQGATTTSSARPPASRRSSPTCASSRRCGAVPEYPALPRQAARARGRARDRRPRRAAGVGRGSGRAAAAA